MSDCPQLEQINEGGLPEVTDVLIDTAGKYHTQCQYKRLLVDELRRLKNGSD